MRAIVFLLAFVGAAGCAEQYHSTFHDAGTHFLPIGGACAPDTATTSQCGYPPQFYCAPSGVCAGACNRTMDCPDGASCVGAGDMIVGECRVNRDGGT
jgi:hypothetical protein